MTNRVLITGGFGTIGGRLAKHLSDGARHDLRLTSRSPRPVPSWAPRSTTHVTDVTDSAGWIDALNGVDTVVHLVSLTDSASRVDPDMAWRVGVEGTRKVVDASISTQVRRIIFLSTGHVYGTPYIGHITEKTPTNPQQPYAETHLGAEALLESVHDRGDLECVRVRLSNGFGRPMRPDNEIWQIVINDLCRQAVTTGRLELRTPGTQQRNFIPYTDVCTALAHLIDLDDVGDGLYNLGSTVSMTIAGAARRVQERVRATLQQDLPLLIPDSSGETSPYLNYDSSKIRSTGLSLTDDIDAEIDSLLRYCAENFS